VLSEKLMQWIVLVSLSGGSGGLGGPLQGVLGGLGMPGWGGCCIHQGGKASRRGQRLLHGPLQSQEEILCHEHELGNRKLSSGLRCRPGRQAQQAPRPPRPLDPWVGLAGALLSPVGAMLDASPPPEEKSFQLSALLPPQFQPLLEILSRETQTPQPRSLEWRRDFQWMSRMMRGCFLGPLGLPKRARRLGRGVGDRQELPVGWSLAWSRSLSSSRCFHSSERCSLSRGCFSLSR